MNYIQENDLKTKRERTWYNKFVDKFNKNLSDKFILLGVKRYEHNYACDLKCKRCGRVKLDCYALSTRNYSCRCYQVQAMKDWHKNLTHEQRQERSQKLSKAVYNEYWSRTPEQRAKFSETRRNVMLNTWKSYSQEERDKIRRQRVQQLNKIKGHTSSFQYDVYNFIKQHTDLTVILNDRHQLLNSFLELDIYIPELRLAIECNGTYWHSEIYLKKNYHYNKSKRCEEQNILLINIWEHLWYSDNQFKLKNYILLCLSHRPTIQDLLDYGILTGSELKRDYYNLSTNKLNHKEEIYAWWYKNKDITLYKGHHKDQCLRFYTSGIDILDKDIV